MDFESRGVFDGARQIAPGACEAAGRGPAARRKGSGRLRAAALVMLTLTATMPQGYGQQLLGAGQKRPSKEASHLPPAPAPMLTQPFSLRPTARNYAKSFVPWYGNPILRYLPTTVPKANFENSLQLDDLIRNGKIYLSLSDALALAIENNYDIAIARYNLDIADSDILRTSSGQAPLGAPSGLVTGTLGGTVTTLATGGGPGGTTVGSGGAGSGVSGLTQTTAGAGPAPENLDPTVTGTIQFERELTPQVNTLFSGGKPTLSTNTDQYNFTCGKGFITGADLTVSLQNSRITTDNPFDDYSPYLQSVFRAQLTQHLLQGRGIWINKRFMYQAINDRRITNASFRQQVLYTVDQVENIYWGLVQAYENVQAEQRALAQSTQLLADDKKQVQIGSMAPLDVVNAEAGVASDRQALISAENALNYQQQIIKQAIARNLNSPILSAAPVIPTDRVNLAPIPQENEPTQELVKEAFKRRPELEEAVLTLRNDEITLRGARNALLPTLDAYAFYGSSALGGEQNPVALNFATGETYPPGTFHTRGYGTVFGDLFNSSAPDKGVGFNLSIPISNRPAEATQERAVMEYRQAELRLEQLYTQIRMQVVNAKYALTNDRAAVQAALAAEKYNQESLNDVMKELQLGAATTQDVLMQHRNLATAEYNVIAAETQYAKDRASLYQILATTLKHYRINLTDAAEDKVPTAPLIPGITQAPPGQEPPMTAPVGK